MSVTPIPDGRNTRWEAHRRQRRNDLIRSARAAVHSIGPDVSMEEIATHAGTSKSVFYRYFSDKQGLQQAVAQASIDFMEAELKKAGKSAPSARDGLYTMVLVYLQLADSSPNVYNFSTAIPTGMNIFRENMARFLQRAVENVYPHYKHDQADPGRKNLAYYWAVAAVGFVRAAGEEWIADPGQSDRLTVEKLARNIANWLLVGLDSQGLTQELSQED